MKCPQHILRTPTSWVSKSFVYLSEETPGISPTSIFCCLIVMIVPAGALSLESLRSLLILRLL